MDEDETHPVLEAVKEEMTLVHYTKKDRYVNYFIAVIVVLNFLTVVLLIPWSVLW